MRNPGFEITSQAGLRFGIHVATRAVAHDIVRVLLKHGYGDLKVKGPGERWRVALVMPEYGSDWYQRSGTYRTKREAMRELAKLQPDSMVDLTVVSFTGLILWDPKTV